MKAINYRQAVWFLLCVGLSCYTGCQRRYGENEVLARVGDASLTRKGLTQKMNWEGIDSEQESDYVERWINRELLYQEAKRLGLDKNEELQWEVELVEKEYLVQKLLERTFSKKIEITEEEIESYYEKNKDLFEVDEDEVRLYHLLTQTLDEANLALQSIQAGKPFEEVVESYSVGMLRDRGGDMGYIRSNDVIPEISRIAFRLSENRVSNIISSHYGFHIIKVLTKRTKGEFKALPDVRDEIIQRIRVSKERTIYYDLLFQLQNKTKVSVNIPTTIPKKDSTSAVFLPEDYEE